MGEELKTLKDLVSEEKDFELEEGIPSNIIWPGEIKEEAIRWARFMRNQNKEFEPIERCELSHNRGYVMDADDFIKHFFNITEEDIKQ